MKHGEQRVSLFAIFSLVAVFVALLIVGAVFVALLIVGTVAVLILATVLVIHGSDLLSLCAVIRCV